MSWPLGVNRCGGVPINSILSFAALTGEFGLQKLSVRLEEGWTKVQLTLSRIENHMNIALLSWLLARPKYKKGAQTRQTRMGMVFCLHEKSHW